MYVYAHRREGGIYITYINEYIHNQRILEEVGTVPLLPNVNCYRDRECDIDLHMHTYINHRS